LLFLILEADDRKAMVKEEINPVTQDPVARKKREYERKGFKPWTSRRHIPRPKILL
jgi:hypothetical protein